ncbi:alpha/beta hydrolase family protein [Paraburkholderia terrae]|uniref:Alpha/beta hydrolase n=1 Tax=Paraburkholderia terrae TaxID=311230 RepID=A0A2I8F4A5_9BURK|nr:alpha/beta fold hydrolase [Paraburkholderia terrae]AUT66613.1 alpha/beta hydrolase [Paraburkholderia terrae]
MYALRRALMCSLCVAGLSAAALGHAAEKVVTFTVDGQKITGTLELPENVQTPPVLLMLHGFTGTRNEWSSPVVKDGLFGRCAKALSKKGVASLRIDFRGSGESDGKFEDMTVDSEVKDALAALDFLSSRRDIDSQRISVVGMSLGGAVATAVAGRTTHSLRSVVLWNPGINLPAAFTSIYGEDVMKTALGSGDQAIAVTMKEGGKTVKLKAAFFKSLYTTVPAAEIENYRGPLLLAVGTKDSIVYPQPTSAEALLRYHTGPHTLWTRPVDHGFDVERSATTVDALVEETTDFVLEHSK